MDYLQIVNQLPQSHLAWRGWFGWVILLVLRFVCRGVRECRVGW